LQLQNEWVDQKLARAVKKGIMMARLLADNFEIFHGTGTHQQRRGALPKVVLGGAKTMFSPITAGVVAFPHVTSRSSRTSEIAR
jgi:hypothetical protein